MHQLFLLQLLIYCLAGFATDTPDNPVKFDPSIAGKVPVKFNVLVS